MDIFSCLLSRDSLKIRNSEPQSGPEDMYGALSAETRGDEHMTETTKSGGCAELAGRRCLSMCFLLALP